MIRNFGKFLGEDEDDDICWINVINNGYLNFCYKVIKLWLILVRESIIWLKI